MTPLTECVHEREVLDLVLAGRWPDRSDPETVAHASSCEVCGEVVAVALAMQHDEAAVEADVMAATPMHHDVVPDATLVWWRAQLRAHEEAGRRAARPIALVQGIGIGMGLVAGLSVIRAAWPAVLTGASSTGAALLDTFTRLTAASAAWVETAPLWLTVGFLAAVIGLPLAVYAATKD